MHPLFPAPHARYRLPNRTKREMPLEVIEHGRDILAALETLGFATNGQLARLLFAGHPSRSGATRTDTAATRAAQRSLRRLWLSGLVNREPVILPSTATGFGYQHFVNVLTVKGHKLLQGPKEPDSRRVFRPVKISNQTAAHALAINDFFVLGYRATQQQQMGWHEWFNDRQLTAMKARGSLKLVSIPDAFFVIAHRGRYFGHFLEIDTGSVQVFTRRPERSWAHTVADYGQYFRDYYPLDGYFKGFTAPIVLTVTKSQTRLEHLLQATKRGGGAGVYWYTTREQLQSTAENGQMRKSEAFRPEVLWQPIWRVVNDPAPRSLLDRLNQVSKGV